MRMPGMLQRKAAVGVLAGAVVLGVATGAVAVAMDGDGEAASARPSATPTPGTAESSTPVAPEPTESEGLQDPADLLVTPGAVGPVEVGMSKQEALDTGYLVPGVAEPDGGCPAPPLVWKDGYDGVLDVQASGNGDLLSIGVRQEGPRTRSGFGVGTTWGDLKVVGEDPVEAGYGQTGVRVYDSANAGWIGFLFDTTVDQLADDSVVTFMEVTKGGRPDLMRDGC